YASGLAPADWALCRGLFPGTLPRGIGIDVSGTVEAVGEGVTDVAVGDHVLGSSDWAGGPTGGASDHAIMNRWILVPDGLDLALAATLPMALDTAYWHLSALGLDADKSILVHGAGTTIGFTAVQIALARGMKVIATAGETYADQLRAIGAIVTTYGDGMVQRVIALNGGTVDLAIDTAPVGGVLPELIEIVGGDPKNVMTISDFAAAAELGVRSTIKDGPTERPDGLAEFAQLAAAGEFRIPIAGMYPLEDWRTALEISLGGNARGKLLLLPGATGTTA
ncbi:MAG: NADP-dependent oxidoreductase, partial [Lacisediminihabitans sp.]